VESAVVEEAGEVEVEVAHPELDNGFQLSGQLRCSFLTAFLPQLSDLR
jgi:hypothetical protein